MSIQLEKSSSFYSATTTTTPSGISMKTPFGIEDILYINSNNNNLQSLNKNHHQQFEKYLVKSKSGESDDSKKMQGVER